LYLSGSGERHPLEVEHLRDGARAVAVGVQHEDAPDDTCLFVVDLQLDPDLEGTPVPVGAVEDIDEAITEATAAGPKALVDEVIM
jgi:hypothetical protein